METFELRYFLSAAQTENLQIAARNLAVSPPALSRAISRLEEELGIQLFKRVGRNIALTSEGQEFQRQASRLIDRFDDLKSQFRPRQNTIPISIAGTESELAAFLPLIIDKFKALKISFSLNVQVMSDSKRVERALLDGEVQLGLVSEGTTHKALSKLSLGKVESKTLVGRGHPLFRAAKEGRAVPIQKLLEYEFTSFDDGWRDDKFERKVGLKTKSVEIALKAIETGYYIGYIPPILAAGRNIVPVAVEGCPYVCKMEVHLVSKNPKEVGWMSQLFK